MIWDIIIKLALALIVAGLCRVCYMVGYTKGLGYGIKTMKEQTRGKRPVNPAAPELLESCIGLLGILTPKQYDKQFPNIYRKAKEAIKKAKENRI